MIYTFLLLSSILMIAIREICWTLRFYQIWSGTNVNFDQKYWNSFSRQKCKVSFSNWYCWFFRLRILVGRRLRAVSGEMGETKGKGKAAKMWGNGESSAEGPGKKSYQNDKFTTSVSGGYKNLCGTTGWWIWPFLAFSDVFVHPLQHINFLSWVYVSFLRNLNFCWIFDV